ncbi:MAG: disulfide bond formation protein B [Pseudomonadota bacterium]
MPSPRQTHFLAAAFCAALIAIALYMQHGMGLEPCYLCIVQRLFVIAVGALLLIAALHNPGPIGQRIYSGLGALSALLGGGFSTRQLWLQSLPADQVPACGPPAEYLFDALPLADALGLLLRGDGNCAEIQWALLGISIPGWTLMAFAGLFAVCVWQLLRSRRGDV